VIPAGAAGPVVRLLAWFQASELLWRAHL